MKKITFVIMLLLTVCILRADISRKVQITSSCLFSGKYKYNDFDERATAEFHLGFSLGIEIEKTLEDSTISGFGFNLLMPKKLINKDCLYESNEDKLNLKDNLAIYHYIKLVSPIGRSIFYTKLYYGSGIPYFLYCAFGFGFEIGEKWSMETMLNFHYVTLLFTGSSISYFNAKFGYSF